MEERSGAQEEIKIEEEHIIFEEILPRLPLNSLFRFKLVCKNWLNFITRDPLFPLQHFKNCPKTTNFSFYESGIYHSTNHQFNWPKPSFIHWVSGSCFGLVYGNCYNSTQFFIYNPITKHTVYVPSPFIGFAIGLAYDPHNPSFGFTLVTPSSVTRECIQCGVEVGTVPLEFQVYSSKTGEWRKWEKPSAHQVCWYYLCYRMHNSAVYLVKKRKLYWSLIKHVMWFDVENDEAGVFECPDHDDFVDPDICKNNTEIGECDGELSYTRMTKQGDLVIWLLRDDGEEFEWVKKHIVGLKKVVEENWNTVFEMICNGGNIEHKNAAREQMTTARVLARVEHLSYSGGEEVWFSMETLNGGKNVFSFNLRTQELKLINRDGAIRGHLYPFVPTLLPCPTLVDSFNMAKI